MPNTSQTLPDPSILKNVQIPVVDNDLDSRCLYTFLFEGYGVRVLSTGFIADVLALIDYFEPDILVCEVRFINEDIRLLIQRIRAISRDLNRLIPILVASASCSASSAQDSVGNVECYLIKPIDINALLYEVWSLVYLPRRFAMLAPVG